MGIFSFSFDLLSRAYLLGCGYKSFKAVESEATEDDTQWLTFWTVVSIVQFGEFWTDIIRRWLPFYSELKLALFVWLGAFRGAAMLYNQVIRKTLKEHEKVIDQHLSKAEAEAKKAMKK